MVAAMKHYYFRVIRLAAALCAVLLAVPAFAHANQAPVGCNANNLDLIISKNKTIVRQGEVITYSVYVTNEDNGPSLACDITAATTTVTLPAKDGTPTGAVITIASTQDYLAGTPSTLIGTTTYTVDVNPGVADVVAQADINGILHDAPVNHSASITKTVGTSVTQPHLTLSVTPNPSITTPNSPVTYTYNLTNDSSARAPFNSISISDPQCTAITFVGGDTNGNGALSIGETWQYTCRKTFSSLGTFNSTVNVVVNDIADNRPVSANPATTAVRIVRSTSGLPGLPSTGSGPSASSAGWHGFLHQVLRMMSATTLALSSRSHG